MDALLLLEDGRCFTGEAFGAGTSRVGEAVFNTSMTGYQEILTDPSYLEQVVTMTCPHIGNTGINLEDPESTKVHVSGFVVRSLTDAYSSWRATGSLDEYLKAHNVPGISGIDTRALVRHLRTKGAMKCVLSTDGTSREDLEALIADWPGMAGRALATEVTTPKVYMYAEPEQPTVRISVIDGGAKQNILRLLKDAGAWVRVHPITDTAEAWMEGVDAVLVSNGPGDPAALPEVVNELKKVVGTKPALGICLGHQLLGLALGATTFKLKFGHRGANHPVRDESTKQVEITSQNHGFAVDRDSLESIGGEVTHTNLNDHTVSGFMHREKMVFSVQYHPEACPGPHDSRPLIVERFIQFALGKQQ